MPVYVSFRKKPLTARLRLMHYELSALLKKESARLAIRNAGT